MEGKRDREQEVAERAEPEQREGSVSLRMVLYRFSCRKLLMVNRLILTRGCFVSKSTICAVSRVEGREPGDQ